MAGNEGYIKLHRKFRKWGWYDDANTTRVFLHLLLGARWTETEYRGEKLKAGDVLFGRKRFAKDLGISEQNVRTAIEHLLKTGEISTSKVTNRFTIFHVENWGSYQGQDEDTNQQTNQQLTNNQPTTNHIQESKEYKEYIDTDARAREGDPEKGYDWEIESIIAYLNEKTGKKYKRTASNRRIISDRLDEGYTLADLQKVVDNQCARWLKDPERNQYLAPALLFDGDKIERYLNSPPVQRMDNVIDFRKIAEKMRKGYSHMRLSKREAAAVPFEKYIDIKDRLNELTDEQIVNELKGASHGID